MQAFKLRTTILALLAALMVAWVLAPTASAQGTNLDMALSFPKAGLVPESEPGTLKATVSYTFGQGAQAVVTAAQQSVTVSFKFTNCPSSVLITGPATKILSIPPSATATAGGTVEAQWAITMTREAPGLRTIICTLTAEAGAFNSAGATAPDPAVQTFPVSADYYALVAPKITKKVAQAGPQKNVPFAIELTNFGNARTQINFEQGVSPSGKRWNIVMPDPIILDSPNGGGEGKTVDTATVTVVTPYKNGWNNEQGAYQIIMKVASADQADKKGNDLSANVLVRVRGVYVPGLEPTVMLAALLGSALVLRLRSKDE